VAFLTEDLMLENLGVWNRKPSHLDSFTVLQDEREALANITLQPDYSLEHLVTIHAATSLGYRYLISLNSCHAAA